MARVVDGKFACDSCGRRYTWKAALAGKKAKCACGVVMVVPEAEESAAAQPSDADMYDVAEAPAVAAPRAVPVVSRAAPVERAPQGGVALEYGKSPEERLAFDELVHPPRDLYVPLGLLIAGFVAIFASVMRQVGLGVGQLAAVSFITGGVTLIKTVIVILLALVIAPRFGISFGTFWTAVLKFAAILVFTDGAILWLIEFMRHTGAISASGRMARGTITVGLIFSAAIMSFLMHYLFDMEREETAWVALPMAILSKVIDFVLIILIAHMLAPKPPAPARPVVLPPAPGESLLTNRDRQIDQRIRTGLGVDLGPWEKRSVGCASGGRWNVRSTLSARGGVKGEEGEACRAPTPAR